MSDVVVKVTHFRSLVLSAVRYALGRRTYIAQETVEIIMAHRDALSPNDRIVILRDIREASSLGDGCDAREWLALASALEIDEKLSAERQGTGDGCYACSPEAANDPTKIRHTCVFRGQEPK